MKQGYICYYAGSPYDVDVNSREDALAQIWMNFPMYNTPLDISGVHPNSDNLINNVKDLMLTEILELDTTGKYQQHIDISIPNNTPYFRIKRKQYLLEYVNTGLYLQVKALDGYEFYKLYIGKDIQIYSGAYGSFILSDRDTSHS